MSDLKKDQNKTYNNTISVIDVDDNPIRPTEYSDDQLLYRYVQEISKFPILTNEEEKILLKQYIENEDHEAGKKIVMSHLRLVVKIAMQYKNYKLHIMDIIAEGNIGLMHALKKFDITQQNRFATYAMLWIRANIQDFILRSWSLVKVGSVALRKALLFNMKNIKQQIGILDTDSKELQNQKIAKHLNVDIKEFNDIQEMLFSGETSINQQIGDQTMLDTIAKEEDFAQDISDEEECQLKMNALKLAISELNEREKAIIFARYISDEKSTLEDLSVKFKISRERVRQIEVLAMQKMKKVLSKTIDTLSYHKQN